MKTEAIGFIIEAVIFISAIIVAVILGISRYRIKNKLKKLKDEKGNLAKEYEYYIQSIKEIKNTLNQSSPGDCYTNELLSRISEKDRIINELTIDKGLLQGECRRINNLRGTRVFIKNPQKREEESEERYRYRCKMSLANKLLNYIEVKEDETFIVINF